MTINWTCNAFSSLTPESLYAIMQLRNEVFVVEQQCVYQDADDKDAASWHLTGWDENKLVAYARIIPPGISFETTSIGRVVTSPAYRKTGAGRTLMKKAIEFAFAQFKTSSICIGAQVYLLHFYQSLGFTPCSEEFLEDGIPHIEMLLHK
jgi:ElaA protein